MAIHHELPTHLAVEDRVLAGLSMRQLLLLVSGACGAYALWLQLAWLPAGPRAALVALNLVGSLLLALWRPGGRGVEHWALILLRYALTPRVAVWRPAVPVQVAAPERPWATYAPRVAWDVSTNQRKETAT